MQIRILEGQILPLRHTGDDVRKREAVTTIFNAERKSLFVEQKIISDKENIRNYEFKCTVFVSGVGVGTEIKKGKSSAQI
jgi:hypothetical protein